MTAAVYRSTPSLSVPQTQNTAPVFEFNCLYTHDIKKKAKKWQDGFLRFHTFNKRVMVYDVPRNLIGDCHWTRDEALQEGAELRLERNGVMVEVGDSIGQTETDLSELKKNRKKDTAVNTPKLAVARPAPRPVNGTAPARGNPPQKHRSLGALLGTPKGPLGKAALPQRSPFEDRHTPGGVENEEWENGRPPKRQRMSTTPEWSVERVAKAPSPVKHARTTLWARKVDAEKLKKVVSEAGQRRLPTKEVITLSDNDDNVADVQDNFLAGLSDDALAPSSPVKDKRKDACKVVGRSSSPAFQTQHATPPARPPKEVASRTSAANRQVQPQALRRPISPVEQSKGTTAPRNRAELSRQASEEPRPDPKADTLSHPQVSRVASSKSGQMLRLAASAPKKSMLLCQAHVSKKPMRVSSTGTDKQASPIFGVGREQPLDRPITAQEKLEARLAKIDQKGGSTSTARFQPLMAKPTPTEVEGDDSSSTDMAEINDPDQNNDEECRQQSTHQRSAIDLRRLDEMMLSPAALVAPSRQPRPVKPPSPPPPPPETRVLRRVASESTSAKPTGAKRVPGAPVRCTPTPSPTKSRHSTPVPVPAATTKLDDETHAHSKPDAPAKAVFKPKKKPFQKSVSLNVTSNGTSTVILSKPFQGPGKKAAKVQEPQASKDVGPWSREAFDLFAWRPPNWDEQRWCVKDVEPSADSGRSEPPAGLSGGASLPRAL